MEADHTKMWTGVEQSELCAWMMERLGLEPEPILVAANLTEPQLDQPHPELTPPPTMEQLQELIATMQPEASATSATVLQPPTQVSERYQRLLTKVQQETAAPDRPLNTATTSQPQEMSKRYQRLLARVQEQEQSTR
jgi:hypothetical protein